MYKNIEFQLYDWVDDHEKNSDDDIGTYIIHSFGRCEDGKSVYAKIINFTPYFYILLPNNLQNRSKSYLENVMKELLNHFTNKNNNKVYYKYKQTLKDIQLLKLKIAEGFTNDTEYYFGRLVFTNYDGMKKYKYYLENNDININTINELNKIRFKLYEANFPPLLRCFHIRNISGCSWVDTNNYKLITDENKKISRCDIEIIVNWLEINPIKKDFNAPFRICSFDIECNSDSGDFPQALKPCDKIIQIGATYTYIGESTPYRQYIACLNNTNTIDNCILESFDNERDLLLGFLNEINNNDCDILTGYNISFFDEKYMYDRSKYILNIEYEMSLLSKLKDFKCDFKETKLASTALGENILKYWHSPGRIHIDLMKDIQKTFSLPSYKLDFVASNFIRSEIINYKLINNNIDFECKSIQDINIGDYIHLEVIKGFLSDEVGEKYLIININNNIITVKGDDYIIKELNNIKNNNIKIFWSQAKDDITAKDIFRLFKGDSNDRAIVAKYCIKDCKLVNLLINKLEVVTKNLEMSNVCYVPLSYLFSRGQGIKIFSLCLKEFRKQRYAFPVIKMNKLYRCLKCKNEFKNLLDCPKCFSKKKEEIEIENNSYEGAIVFEPIPNIEYEALATKDYMSLYPSSIMQKNMSHETIIENVEYDNLPNITYYNAQFKESDGTIKYRRFAKIDNKLGVLPNILDNLLKERKIIKKLMKTEQDPFKYRILDAKQFAVKITANSLYGQLGASTSPVCKRDIAACTTSTGREMLILAKKYDEEILPCLINSLKYFYKYNNNEQINYIYNNEIKTNNEQLINQVKTYISTITDKTLQPIVRYGDSVIGTTPLLLQNIKTNKIFICSIKNLIKKNLIIRDDNKEYIEINNINTWTDKGWTKINRVIKHKLDINKKLYRITTHMGSVVVTEDHSLLLPNGTKVTPNMINIGDALLHSFPIFSNTNTNNIINIETKIFNDDINALKYYYYAKQHNIELSVDYINNNYILSPTNIINYNIKKINIWDVEEEYVYDLTTENHHFHAGVGSLIVHNTDSIFSCYRFRDNIIKTNDILSLNIWKNTVEFAKYLIEPFFQLHEFEIFNNIFNEYYNIDKITNLSLPILELPEQNNIYNNNIILPLQHRIKYFIKEYMEESYLPWLWTLTELIEKNNIKMFDSKLILWAEHQLSKLKLVAVNLYEKRKNYIVNPILNEINNIFINNKYHIPSSNQIESFTKKFINTEKNCFDFSNEININYDRMYILSKNLLEKTIKEKWNCSDVRKDLIKNINEYINNIIEFNNNENLNILYKFIVDSINENINLGSDKISEILIINLTNYVSLNIKFNNENLHKFTKLFIDKYLKNNGTKSIELIIEEFIEKDLNLNLNLYITQHYDKIINFVNNNLRQIDMTYMDKNDIKYIYYWIQPRWEFINKNKQLIVDIYEGGNSITDKRSLEYTMELGKISGEFIQSKLDYPHVCEYEKCYWPFLISSKKRYVGNKYEDNPDKYKLDFMGIVLKRRDNAIIVKEICGGLIDILINKRDPVGAKQFVKNCIQDMFDGKYNIKYFLQSRTLKLKESYKDWTKIAHIYLADKITKRNPGTSVQSGDRIEFAIIKIPVPEKNIKILQGDIIETPDYIKENNLEIDYLFYLTNQIMNPTLQFLQLVDKESNKIFEIFINKYSEIKRIKNEEKIKKELKKNEEKIIKELNKQNKIDNKIKNNIEFNKNQKKILKQQNIILNEKILNIIKYINKNLKNKIIINNLFNNQISY